MATIVTGGSGLVGKALQSLNLSNFVFLSSKDCDLRNYESVLETFKLIKPTRVIHLAAQVGGLFKNMRHKVSMLEDNLLINTNVVKASYSVGVTKFIGCLSTCIFPDKTTYPINEEMLHDGAPHHSNNAYAYAKRILDIQCQCYREQYGLNYYCIIPTNIYGEFDNFNLENAHVIPALIHKCYLAKQGNIPFTVCGTGKPLRQFIYSQDLAKILIWCLDHHDWENIIISPNEDSETSIGHVATLIASEFDYKEHMIFDTTMSDGQYKKTADNNLLQKHLSDYPFTPIEVGIRKTIQWFIKNWDIVRK